MKSNIKRTRPRQMSLPEMNSLMLKPENKNTAAYQTWKEHNEAIEREAERLWWEFGDDYWKRYGSRELSDGLLKYKRLQPGSSLRVQ